MANYQSTRDTAPLLPKQPHDASISINTPQTQASIDQVRDAFVRRDIIQSIELHNQRQQSVIPNETHDQVENHTQYSGQISSAIQGVLTSLAIIQTGFAAQISFPIIFLFLIANAIANGFGFSSNDVLSTISERLFIEGEAAREQWEVCCHIAC